MKNKLFALFIALIASINTVWSSDTEVDGIYYNFNYGTKTAEVTWGGQNYASMAVEYQGNIDIPSIVEYSGTKYNVTSIGENAFRDCVSLLSLTLPNSITSIGHNAFENCTLLGSINIPSSVTSIGHTAFHNCRSLTSITIPDGVTKIETNTFATCSNLVNITFHGNITCIDVQAFNNCSKLSVLHIPEGVITIRSQAFMACTNLTLVSIPSSVLTIEQNTFYDCRNLTDVIFYAQLPPYIENENIFLRTSVSSIYVPCGSIEYYRTNLRDYSGCVKNLPSYKLRKVVKHGSIQETSHSTICDSIVTLTVTPDYGYQFVQWSDGIMDNPRTIVLTQDTTMEAIMDKDLYTITTSSSNESWGNASGDTTALYLDTIKITATPNYGYHFVRWDDNETSNPRSVVVTPNSTYQAIFAKNTYYIETNAINGMVSNPMQAYYLDSVKLTAIPSYGYHFIQWSDGVKEYSRVIVLTQDTTFTAEFAKNIYNIYKVADNTQGAISGPSQAEYLDTITLMADPNVGYHFAQWSDGVTETPRSIILTKDTTLTALFAINQYTITWKNDDGGTIDQTIVEHGNTPMHLKPTKAATAQYTYTFAGWFPELVTATEDASYTATFDSIINKYTITFKNGEQELQSTEVEYGQVPAYNGTTPTKSADAQYTYTFIGWSPEITSVTGAAIYTATFNATVNKYIVTFKNGEQDLQSTEVEYGQVPTYNGAVPTKPATVQYSYIFAGWSPNVVSVIGDATYTATFDSIVNKYTIIFKNGDQELQSTEVEYGQMPAYNGTAPTKPATAQYTYTFNGWSPELVAVTGTATYMAKFDSTINSYTITWKNDDGSTIDQTTVEYGQVPAHADPSKVATAEFTYTFAGWSPNVVAVTGDAEYIATYTSTRNSYTITWKNDDGSIIDQTTVEYGQVPTHAEATKTATAQYAYTFAGWSPNIVAVTGDTTYTATYIATVRKYTIAFLDDDGSLISQQSVEYGQIPQQDSPTKQSTAKYTYIFAGWTPEIVAVTENATYTATYTTILRKYTITFLDDNGVLLSDEQWNYGEIPSCEEPTKSDDEQYTYTFAGWTPEVVPVVGEATYTATYTAKDKHEGFENVSTEPAPQKVMIDGTIYILRGDRVYTLQGQELK